MWAHPTGEKGGGALQWRTPASHESGVSVERLEEELLLPAQASNWAGERNWPTPTALDRPRTPETMAKSAAFRKRNANQNTVPLYLGEVAQNWPTPAANEDRAENYTLETSERHLGEGRHQAERLAAQSGPPAHQTQTDGNESSESDQTSPRPSTKRLNPSFVEWMMGVPIGWTSLKPLGMGSFRQWLQNFSEVYEAYGELGEV